MKLNELKSKKCWVIMNYDDGSKAHDVTVESVHLTEKSAQLAYARLWFDSIFDQGDIDQETEEELNLMQNDEKKFNFSKFEKLAEKQDDARPHWNNFDEYYSIQESELN